MKNTQNETQHQEQDNFFICEECLRLSNASHQVNPLEKEKYIPTVKLPLYVYPADDDAPSVLIGYVKKCLRCHRNNEYEWMVNVPQKYSSITVRQALIEANEDTYTKGLTEAEIFFPKAFEALKRDRDVVSYSKHFNELLEEYKKMTRKQV